MFFLLILDKNSVYWLYTLPLTCTLLTNNKNSRRNNSRYTLIRIYWINIPTDYKLNVDQHWITLIRRILYYSRIHSPPFHPLSSIFAKRELLAGSRTKVDDALSHLLSGCNNSSPNDNICRNKQVYTEQARVFNLARTLHERNIRVVSKFSLGLCKSNLSYFKPLLETLDGVLESTSVFFRGREFFLFSLFFSSLF